MKTKIIKIPKINKDVVLSNICKCGYKYHNGNCIKCPAGTKSTDDGLACIDCGENEVSNEGACQCTACSLGQQKFNSTTCEPCPVGYYSNDDAPCKVSLWILRVSKCFFKIVCYQYIHASIF